MNTTAATTIPDLRPPYPWFGGKTRIAKLCWRRFGVVRNYVEPFFGGGAMLLARPLPVEGVETLNDINGWLTNFWRSIKADPDAVAEHAADPVSEIDLHARGDALFYRGWTMLDGTRITPDEFCERMRADETFCDPRAAGWWVWGQCSWIGDNWGRNPQNCCVDPDGNPSAVVHSRPFLGRGQGVNRQLPHLGNAGMGVNRKLPHLSDAGMGVNRKLPHLGNAGMGVNRKLAESDGRGDGVTDTSRKAAIRQYLRGLAERVCRVRICCGDWSRVCGPAVTVSLGLTAVLLDPPYGVTDRDSVYGEHEDRDVSASVREWAIEWGRDKWMKIALCGYKSEHLMPDDWECVAWKASGGYAGRRKEGVNENARRERIWFSPHCLHPDRQRSLF